MAARKTTQKQLIRPEFTEKPVGELAFDEQNPRLASEPGLDTEDDIISKLWHEMAVDEVADSIAANGFFKEEPLIVIEGSSKHKGKFVVLEGNRRLAAVRLLLDEKLRKRIGASDIPTIDDAVREQIQHLPVAVYKRREDVWAYLGFRHINGPKPWDALSKAQYVAKIFEDQKIPLEQIAKQIGDRNVTVKRLYRGFTLLRQAEQQLKFSREDINANRFYFSHLYTAADQTEFQEFLGIDAVTSLTRNPVGKKYLKNLDDLLLWIYGKRSQEVEPLVQSQFPDLNTLRAVVRKSEGIAALRAGYGLERASEIAIGDTERFRDAMTRAKENLVQANGTVTTGYKGDEDVYSLSEEISKLGEKIHIEVKRIYEDSKTSKGRAKK